MKASVAKKGGPAYGPLSDIRTKRLLRLGALGTILGVLWMRQ